MWQRYHVQIQEIQLQFCKYVVECGFLGSLVSGDKIILNLYSALTDIYGKLRFP